ncbi:MAG: hypothetical protein D4R68_08065 [Ignavibacteriales bacterium]|nr:MAG: hypothetical protein D4R68_08065 [Ignavibacteriales bacterium]
MRKIYSLLIFFFFAGLSFAQDQVQVTLSQPPPNQLRATDLWKAILINTTKSTLHITLSGTLEVKGEGIVVDGKSGLMSLPPGTKMITYNDVKTGNVNFKPGKWSEAFSRTGNAPSGDYTICIHVKAEDGIEIGSSCIDQTIATIIPEEVSPHLTVKLIPPPPNQLKTTNLWRIVATNASALAYNAFLITVDLKEKTTGIQVESKLRSVMISGSKNFSFNDFNLADLTYRNTKLQEAYGKNMNAPDGNYTICVYVKNEKGEEVARDCIDQTIATIIPEDVSPHLTVKLIPPPPNQLKKTDLWRLVATNASAVAYKVFRISIDIKDYKTGIQAESKLSSVLISGSKSFSFSDFNLAGITYRNTKLQEAFEKNMNAPDGNYTICVYVINEKGEEVARDCIDQTITTIIQEEVSPQLISPADGSKLNSNQPILFTWMLPSIKHGDDYNYRIKVVEILGNQSPSEAVKLNPAWFEREDIKTKTLIYPVAARKFEKGKKYAWQIGAYADNNEIGKSETWSFIYGSEELPEKITEIKQCDVFKVEFKKTTQSDTLSYKLLITNNYTGKFAGNKPGSFRITVKGDSIVSIVGGVSGGWQRTPSKFPPGSSSVQWISTSGDIPNGITDLGNISLQSNTPNPIQVDYEWLDKEEVLICKNSSVLNKSNRSHITNSTDSTSVGGSGTVAVNDTIKAGQNGEFKVIVTDVTTESDSSVTGKGRVHINWLGTNVAVEFKKIRVDTTKRLTSGGIVTTESGSSSTSYLAYPLAWAESVLTGPGAAHVVDHIVNWSNGKIDNLVTWVNSLNYGQPQINYQSNIPPPVLPDYSLKMPFGLQFNNGNQKLVITEMVFKKDSSKINFLAQEKFTKSGTPYTLGFAGKYFPIHPSSINFSSGRVELAEDIKIPNTTATPKMIFNFKKGTPNSGCYVEWDSTGVKDISLGLEVKFTRDWLLPIPTSTDSVTATIVGNGTSMHDILLTGTLDSCEIVGTNGIKIQASPMSLDLSDSRNPLDMHFPNNYPNDSTITWQGFYVKSFVLTLPDTWKTGTNLTPPVITASNFVIDDMGLTTKIKAVNVFNLQSGRIADLSASLDTVEISIISSSLVSGKAKGILVLPISEVTTQNSLKYTATFNQVSSGNNFQIAILPVGPIDADIFKGKLTLLPTSNISANLSPNLNTLSINLNGTFKWDSPNFPIKGIKMELGFENVGLNYAHNSTTNTLNFNPGTWSFASPPKWLANFPVSIKKIYYKSLTKASLPSPNMELLRGALMIDIVANLTEDIGGTTTLGASFAIELNKTDKKFTPKFIEVFLDSISVHADMPAVKIDGNISIRNEDPVYGNGFLGELTVVFTSVGLKARALVEFGNTNYLYGSLYRYWRVEADVLLPPPGVPFLTGLAFRGFGGGAYYNMLATQATSNKTPSGKKFTFTPLKSTMGLRVATTIATTPKEETFNADVGLLAQFSKSQGLTYIAFTGDFWVGAGFAKRPTANISGTVNVSYDFPDKHFNLSASVNVNAPPITTPSPANLVLDIRGKTNKWFFKFGEPVPNGLNNVDVFGVHLYEYLMFGNDIVAPSGFTQTFKDGYHGVFGTDPGIPVIPVNTLTATGKGFALGIGFKFNKDVNFNLVGSYSAELKLNAGAELNLAFAEYNGNNCEYPSERIGINGWQASGSIGFYASVLASVKHNSTTWNIADIKAGGWLQGKFPNPVYVTGLVEGSVKIGHFTTWIHSTGDWYYNAWDDWGWSACVHLQDHYLVNTSFNKGFEYGTNCSGITSAGDGATVVQGDAAQDQQQLLIQYVHPAQQYSFPLISPLAVQYGLIPNNVFDVSEQQSDGSIKNRTFKMVVTTNLKIHNANGSLSNVVIKKNENNLGEYLYTVVTPIVINTTTAKTINQTLAQKNTVNTSIFANSTLTKNTATIGQNLTTTYPLPPATNTYNNLPPEPPEIKNNLTVNKDYTFTVTATLKEYISNSWVDAKNKNNSVVTQTVKKNFRTGPMVIVASTNNSKNTLINK